MGDPVDRHTGLIYIVLAGLLAVAFAVVTPPFQAPDEVGHFWRAYSLARGYVRPLVRDGRPGALLPRGVRDLVAVMWVNTAGDEQAKIGIERLRTASQISLQQNELTFVRFPAFYTPVPYLPQLIACWIGDQLGARPLSTFYATRLCNVLAGLALMFTAIRRSRQPWTFIAIGALPMTLYLFGSCSPDTTTIGVAIYVTSLVVDEAADSPMWLLALGALVLALCKPVYFLIPLLGFVHRPWSRREGLRFVIVLAVVVTGTVIAARTAQQNYFPVRPDMRVDPMMQRRIVEQRPLHFLDLAASDYVRNRMIYAEQFVGRLGWLDVSLPMPLINAILVFMLCVSLTTPATITIEWRLSAACVVIMTAAMISLSQYLVWSPVGADHIDGIQGRYFLPTGALVLLTIGGLIRKPLAALLTRSAFAVTALTLNVVAIIALVRRYY